MNFLLLHTFAYYFDRYLSLEITPLLDEDGEAWYEIRCTNSLGQHGLTFLRCSEIQHQLSLHEMYFRKQEQAAERDALLGRL